jgi:hypothetical protein
VRPKIVGRWLRLPRDRGQDRKLGTAHQRCQRDSQAHSPYRPYTPKPKRDHIIPALRGTAPGQTTTSTNSTPPRTLIRTVAVGVLGPSSLPRQQQVRQHHAALELCHPTLTSSLSAQERAKNTRLYLILSLAPPLTLFPCRTPASPTRLSRHPT